MVKYQQELYTYPSGLRLVFIKTPDFTTAKFTIMVGVGSEDESTPAGVAHLLEHSIFKGTRNYSQEEISEKFSALSASVNASTSSETTMFKATFPKRNVDAVLKLYSEMLHDSVFDKDKLEKEKVVVEEEILMGEDEPDQVAFDNLIRAMYKDVGIGNDIAGKIKLLRKVSREDLVKFHSDYYHAKNFIVSVIGDFDFEYIKKLVDENFNTPFIKPHGKEKSWSKPSSAAPTTVHEKKKISQANIMFGFRSAPFASLDRMKLWLMSFILGGSMSSRLFKKIRNELSLCYSVFSYEVGYKNNGLFAVSLTTSAKNQAEAISAVNEEIQKMIDDGVTDEEFEIARNLDIDKFLMSQDYPKSGLNYLAYTGELLDSDAMLEFLKTVTKDEVVECFRKYISLDKEFISIVSPN